MKIHADLKELMRLFNYTERDLAILLNTSEKKIKQLDFGLELKPIQILKLAVLFHSKICDFTHFDISDNFLDYMCKNETGRKKLKKENGQFFKLLSKYPDYAEYPSAPSKD